LPLIPALADVYRSVDPQGHVQYSDTPSPGAELIRIHNLPPTSLPTQGVSTSSVPATASNASAGSTPASIAASASKPSDPAQAQLAQQAAKQALDKDLAATRADQCKTATDNYNGAVQARRIYKTGQDGERQYLTDEEADQQRLGLRMAMDNACGTSP
jgi:cytoskeletal protein RodZ